MPAARAVSIDALMGALDHHLARAKRRTVTTKGAMVEYILLAGVNDRDADADALGALLAGRDVVLNLIPFNPTVAVDTHGYAAPTAAAVERFRARATRAAADAGGKLLARVRREMGDDVAGACGQLALVMLRSLGLDTEGTLLGAAARALQSAAAACLFALTPFAYLFHEAVGVGYVWGAAGFAGRAAEAAVLLGLLAIIARGLISILAALLDETAAADAAAGMCDARAAEGALSAS